MTKGSNNAYLYHEIKDKIKEETLHLPPNTRIDTRVKMMKKYNVTRTTIEKAISALIGENYLYSIDGSGTYIAERTDPPVNQSVASWGVILPNIVSDTYPEILRSIEDVANDHNINVVICNTDHSNEKQEQYIQKLVNSDIQGMIIVPAVTDEPATASFQLLTQKGIPFVFCNRGISDIKAPRVISNNFFGAYTATKHLIKLGYTRIAFLSLPRYSGSEQRYQGYLGAMYEAGLDVNMDYVIFEDKHHIENPGFETGKRLLRLDSPPDAVLCFNDKVAKGLYNAAGEFGLQIGVDLGVVGYDDSKLCETLPVKLTSVRYPKYETGSKAAEILLKMIAGEKVDPNYVIVLQPQLIVRQSCKLVKMP
ncbi:MAG: GntR family transcriptional regulator [Paenibacillaceae bacterium]|nr:GntR family transcriptional regulator [Paenibacillaceae bacterium]